MQYNRIALLLTVAAAATLIGIGLSGNSQAYYGDPRFYASQPPVTNRVVHNAFGYSPSEEHIVTNPQGITFPQLLQTLGAVTNWNDAIRNPPNSITKYPLHYNSVGDPSATIVINFVSDADVQTRCGPNADACNDLAYPLTNIWVKSSKTSTALVTHELGHSLWYTDQYYSNFTCSPADTIMNVTGAGCHNSITTTDVNDFQAHYEPTYQSADATYPYTTGSTWSALYQVGEIFLYSPGAQVEWDYYWDKRTDTNGTRIQDFYTPKDTNFTKPSYNIGSRYCFLSEIYNEVGYPGTRSWSPRSQYSCIGAAQNQSAGFLLGTSDRNSPSGNTLYVRVKNFSGGNRDVAIFGPNFANIGCGYVSVAYLGMRTCTISLSRGAYSELTWFAGDGSGHISWGYLDFE